MNRIFEFPTWPPTERKLFRVLIGTGLLYASLVIAGAIHFWILN